MFVHQSQVPEDLQAQAEEEAETDEPTQEESAPQEPVQESAEEQEAEAGGDETSLTHKHTTCAHTYTRTHSLNHSITYTHTR